MKVVAINFGDLEVNIRSSGVTRGLSQRGDIRQAWLRDH